METGTLDLIATLMREVDTTLQPLLPLERPIALLDFPVYPNVGDSMIWLGALASLRRLGLRGLRYACSFKTYSRRDLARRIGDGTIVLSGGGNFGDRYEPHQRLREDVLISFPRHRIVQLPQSIWFRTPKGLDRARSIVGGHPDFTLLVRDRDSLALAAREFPGARSRLCPDMALGLGPLRPVRPPTDRIVWLSRTDSESTATSTTQTPPGVERTDWVDAPPTALGRLLDRAHRRVRNDPGLMRWLYGTVARSRVRRGVQRLSGARAVVTDRLHGHIMCMLLGIPHVLLPEGSGKIRAFYETWTHTSPLVRWCESEPEALRLALEMRP